MSNDEQLLAKAKQLDPAALRAMHQRFYEPVARYIQFKVGDPYTVEDLSGEVFVRALEGLKRGQAWRDSPQGWIMGIARNVVADYYRQRERVKEVSLNEGITSSEAADPTHYALAREQQQLLREALEQLTDEQRDVILLRFMEGIDIKGVAKAINKTPGAIKGLQFRALRALADLMQKPSAEEALDLKK
jgi:RNA polymerase sigma-70 factor (ECF subfamily)